MLCLGLDVSTQGVKAVAVRVCKSTGDAAGVDGDRESNEEDGHLREVAVASVNYDVDLPQYGTSGGVHRGRIPCTSSRCESVTSPPIMWIHALELVLDRLDDALRSLPVDLDSRFPSNKVFRARSLGAVVAVSGAGQQHGSVYWKNDPSVFDFTSPLLPPFQLSGATAAIAGSADQDGDRKRAERQRTDLNALHGMYRRANAFAIEDSPIWMDTTATADCEALEKLVGGAQQLANRTGSAAHERFTINIIHRLAHEPQMATQFQETARISLVSSFMASVLVARWVGIDWSDGSGMNCMDLERRQWDAEICEWALPGQRPILGELIHPSSIVGPISAYFVERWGFMKDCQVVAWTGDNPSSLAGLRVRAGDVAVSLGTSDTVFTAMHLARPQIEGHCFVDPTHPHDYMALLCYKNGSLLRQHIRDRFAAGDWDCFDRLMRETPPGNHGKLGMTFLEPEIVPRAPAGSWWFDMATSDLVHDEHLISDAQRVRGIVEGQLVSMLLHSRKLGLAIDSSSRILATGGASMNASLLQLAADVFGAPVYTLAQPNSAAVGAAYRAWHGLVHSAEDKTSFEEAVSTTSGSYQPILAAEPNAAYRTTYDELCVAREAFEQCVSKALATTHSE